MVSHKPQNKVFGIEIDFPAWIVTEDLVASFAYGFARPRMVLFSLRDMTYDSLSVSSLASRILHFALIRQFHWAQGFQTHTGTCRNSGRKLESKGAICFYIHVAAIKYMTLTLDSLPSSGSAYPDLCTCGSTEQRTVPNGWAGSTLSKIATGSSR